MPQTDVWCTTVKTMCLEKIVVEVELAFRFDFIMMCSFIFMGFLSQQNVGS